jgi:quercetin dioxygenase-like cupin family protein
VELDVPQPIVLGPGEGDSVEIGGAALTFKAAGEVSDAFSLTESRLPPGFPGPPAHIHETYVDSFYVLAGTLTVRLGAEELEAAAGSFVCVPPGVVHTFMNRSDGEVRVLNFMAPGGFEQYFREVAAAPDEMAEILARYDFKPA